MTEQNKKESAKKAKKQPWCKKRHSIITHILCPFVAAYIRLKYHLRVEKCKDKRQYLILANHQTALDQFFLTMIFRRAIYFVASEDIFSMGFLSKVIQFLVAPIPIKKSTNDSRAVRLCRKVALEGGSVAIFPEGNRTFSGNTEFIKPSLEQLVRFLRLPVAIVHIEGGYGIKPRWSDVVRRGHMRAYVHKIIEVEEFSTMSSEEFVKCLSDALYVNDTDIPAEYHHKKSAEYLERVMYFCPKCGLSEWYSEGDTASCLRCGQKIKYLPSLRIEGVESPFPYDTMGAWYRAQNDFMNALDTSLYLETPAYEDTVEFSEVIPEKKKQLIDKTACISLYGDRYEIKTERETLIFPFADVHSVAVLGKNKLNFYFGEHIYQIKSHERFNAVKYMHFYFRHTHILKGELYDQFLGL